MDDELNREILCESCKEKKIEKLTDKCENEEMARLLYDSKLNADCYDYIQWIPFNEFEDIGYLTQGGFGVVYKAGWINYCDTTSQEFGWKTVVLKKLRNSVNYTKNIFKEVK